MNSEIETLILTGGQGRRMGRLTENTQKCLLPVEGRPAISIILNQLVSVFGSVDLKIAVSYKADDVIEYVDKNKPKNTSVTYIHVPKGVDDFDAYQQAESYIHGTFLALPGDILIDSSVYAKVIDILNTSKAEMVTTISPLNDIAKSHPVVKVNGLQVVEYLAKAPQELDPDHLRDLMIFASTQKIFHYMRCYPNQGGYFGNVVQKIVENERSLYAVAHNGPWLHLAYPEDLLQSIPFQY